VNRGAYYNEHDRQKAAWLRHLIEEGEIAAGVVDDRPIQAVQPEDLHGFAQCHFFAGIGLWSLCFRRAGWDDDRPVWSGSCPCGPFSRAGKQRGFDDPRHLWPEWLRLIEVGRPGVLFGEQSEDADEWLDLVQADMEGRGYAFGPVDIPAAGFRGAHRRQRFGFVADADNAEWWSARAPWHDGDWPATGRVKGHGHAGERGALVGMGDAGGDRSAAHTRDHGQVRRVQETQRQPKHGPALPGGSGASDVLGHPGGAGLPDAELGIVRRSGWWPEGRAAEQPGDPDWLLCRDSRWRPVESGTCPLVDESPARMGRLRGYGDAIDVEAFTNLIGAYLDCAPARRAAA
jgi:DNA (cytosine-5)-methyltransferase 1